MNNRKVRVAVNGYGVIGKRIADAVAGQEDMELVGVADVVSDWRIKVAIAKRYPVYASTPESIAAMRAAGVPVVGNLDDLLQRVDVIADATPKKVASANFEKYKAASVKSIFQGGEKHELTGHSFVAQANYASALGRNATRVVSCNTTSNCCFFSDHRAHGALLWPVALRTVAPLSIAASFHARWARETWQPERPSRA